MQVYHQILEKCRNKYLQYHPQIFGIDDCGCQDVETISKWIYDGICSDKPFMVSRFGSVELCAIVNGLAIGSTINPMSYITGKVEANFWTKGVKQSMTNNAGFYPSTDENLSKFTSLALEDAKQIDILGSWIAKERVVDNMMNYRKCRLLLLEPYWAEDPWSRALEGKKVLVVHPFSTSIKMQYEKRLNLFKDKRVLPTFSKLIVIQAVQSIGGG